jgi:hypothetical protein
LTALIRPDGASKNSAGNPVIPGTEHAHFSTGMPEKRREQAAWSGNGKEVFYKDQTDDFSPCPVNAKGSEVAVGRPQRLFTEFLVMECKFLSGSSR